MTIKTWIRWCQIWLECVGPFHLYQRFWKFWSEVKWKGPFLFLLPGTFGITLRWSTYSGSFFAALFLTNRFTALHVLQSLHLCKESEKGIKNGKITEPFLLVGPV